MVQWFKLLKVNQDKIHHSSNRDFLSSIVNSKGNSRN